MECASLMLKQGASPYTTQHKLHQGSGPQPQRGPILTCFPFPSVVHLPMHQVHVCAGAYICVYVETRGQLLETLPQAHQPFSFKMGSPTGLDLTE